MDAQKAASITSRLDARNRDDSAALLKPQWMTGTSERLLVSHYEHNYGGALRRQRAVPIQQVI